MANIYVIRNLDNTYHDPIIGVFTSKKKAKKILKHCIRQRQCDIRQDYNRKIEAKPDHRDYYMELSKEEQEEATTCYLLDHLQTNILYHDNI